MSSTLSELHLDYKPDAAQAAKRTAAWWDGEILDRPTIQVSAPRSEGKPAPAAHHADMRERWMDTGYVLDCFEHRAENTYWGGEYLPSFNPNLGPDILAAAFGAELEFGNTTSWSSPIIEQWDTAPPIRFDRENVYLKKIMELTQQGLQRGAGKFLVGLTDIHPGGDLAAALRGNQALCMDLVTHPSEVHQLLKQIESAFFSIYDLQHECLLQHGQSLTTAWLPLYAEGRYYIPSNDFSCMISPAMFEEFFLPELIEEMRWLDRSVYHLDGPDALRHLETLLAIPELDAVQFVCGAGSEPSTRWMGVLQRIQAAGKNIHVAIRPDELDDLMAGLKPHGVMPCTWASSVEEADALVARIANWR